MDENGRGRRPTVEVETVAPDIAIATLRGEHDLATRAELTDALARASGHSRLLVDLGACTFLDSTVIGLIVSTCQRMWERDRRLELVIPPEAETIRRVVKIAGLTTFLTIHATRAEALAVMQAEERSRPDDGAAGAEAGQPASRNS
jgi:anti-anti-sigma factor